MAGGATPLAERTDIKVIRTKHGIERTIPFNYKEIGRGKHSIQTLSYSPTGRRHSGSTLMKKSVQWNGLGQSILSSFTSSLRQPKQLTASFLIGASTFAATAKADQWLRYPHKSDLPAITR
jgi:hypothetical protein